MNSTGWTIFVAMLGSMAGLEAVEMSKMHSWVEITTPGAVGVMLGHFAAVVGAFLGGKIIQPIRDQSMRTRGADRQAELETKVQVPEPPSAA